MSTSLSLAQCARLVITCHVVVCDGTCPVALCEDREQPLRVRGVLALQAEAVLEIAADGDSIPQDNSFNKLERLQSDDQLCLSPTRIVLAFGVLLLILVLALLFSCVLWMKARRSTMPTHHPHPCIRRPYVVQTRTQHCIL